MRHTPRRRDCRASGGHQVRHAILIRVHLEEREKVKRAAARMGLTVQEWAWNQLDEAATAVLES
jgi:hypothetical protein